MANFGLKIKWNLKNVTDKHLLELRKIVKLHSPPNYKRCDDQQYGKYNKSSTNQECDVVLIF